MPRRLRVSFPVDGRLWMYDAVTNRICKLRPEAILSVEKELTPISGVDVFCVEKMHFPATKEEYLKELSSCMTHLMLEITQACTLRCSYCIYSGNYEGERSHAERHMSLKTAMDAVRFFQHHSQNTAAPIISFYGGEALMKFDLMRQIVKESIPLFGGRRVLFRIATNGTIISDEVCAWLREHDFVMLDITLNGYVHDRYRRLKNGDGSLQLIEKNLAHLRAYYPQVFERQVRFLCNYADAVELKAIMDYYQENDLVPALVTGIIREGGNDIIQSLGCSNGKHAKAMDELKQSYCECPSPFTRTVFDASMLLIHARSAERLKKNAEIENCCFPFMTNCYVDVDGNFTLCEKMPGTGRFGNIYTGFDMPKLMEMMKKFVLLKNTYCRNCWAQRLCTRCFVDIHKAKQFSQPCDWIRQKILEDLTLYCHIYECSPALFTSFSDILRKSEDVI